MSTPPGTTDVVPGNAESRDAWDGPLFDRFARYRHIVVAGLAIHGEVAMKLHPPAPGDRVLDLGCGFGDTTQQLAALAGPEGSATGVDVAPRFIAAAREEAAATGAANVAFEVRDVQAGPIPGGPYDLVFSRMGTMFFANPVVALRSVREAMRPGGRLVMVVWRRREDNPWIHRAQLVTERFVERPETSEEPTCGPGPFSMAGADTTSDVLMHAGFGEIALRRSELPILLGGDVEEAIDIVMALGPAGELLRLAGESAAHLHAPVREALREDFVGLTQPDGTVVAGASTWIVTAVAP